MLSLADVMVRMTFSYRDEIRELNELTRKEASGSFIRLSDGFTHYELSNTAAKEAVVLVHGFSVPYFIFDPTFEFLTQSGFRTLRYDLFGRGFSDRPETEYNIELFVRQLRELLDGLSSTYPVSLVGLSTGGPITATFTARFPERVNKLVLIDPVGARPFPLGRALKLLAVPFAGEVLIGLLWSIRVVKKIASRLPDGEQTGEFGPNYMVQMQYKGFKRALLSTIRNNMLGSFLDVYERIGKMNKPVLLFWGPHDRTVPFEHNKILRKALPNVRFHAIENTGHIPHFEKPAQVNPILLKFLKA